MDATVEFCHKCGSHELDASGRCPACGDAAPSQAQPEPAPSPKPGVPGFAGLIQMDISGAESQNTGETPEWKLELSKRLVEIRRKRGLEISEAPTLPFANPENEQRANPGEAGTQPVEAPKPNPKTAVRRPRPAPKIQERIGSSPARQPQKNEAALPLFRANKTVPRQSPAAQAGGDRPSATITDPDPEKVQKLIDSIMLRQGAESAPSIPAVAAAQPRIDSHPHEEKVVLLSRTLSGLIDLLIIGLFTGSFIIAADIFSGIDIVDRTSKAYYTLLLLATHLVYSFFFLGIANQTVGMMIKDLRIVGSKGQRPSLACIGGRSLAYLLSWLSCGAGFVWAIFDRQSRCWHDRLSGTRVVRV